MKFKYLPQHIYEQCAAHRVLMISPNLKLVSFHSGHKDGASSLAVQRTVREEEEGVVSRAPKGIQRGLEDCVQR